MVSIFLSICLFVCFSACLSVFLFPSLTPHSFSSFHAHSIVISFSFSSPYYFLHCIIALREPSDTFFGDGPEMRTSTKPFSLSVYLSHTPNPATFGPTSRVESVAFIFESFLSSFYFLSHSDFKLRITQRGRGTPEMILPYRATLAIASPTKGLPIQLYSLYNKRGAATRINIPFFLLLAELFRSF